MTAQGRPVKSILVNIEGAGRRQPLLLAARSVTHAASAAARAAKAALRRLIGRRLSASVRDRSGPAADQSLHMSSAARADIEGAIRHLLPRLKPVVTGVALIFVGWHKHSPGREKS